MEEDDGDELQTPKSPFWMQTTTNLSRIQRYRRRLSSLFFNSFVLIIFLLLFALISMVFIIPSLIDRSSNVFRPNLVKRSWDSINLVLVVIALVFGFLSRNVSDDESKLNFDNGFDRSESELSSGAPINPIMYDLQHQSMDSAIGLRRQRTSVSYPDLRELSPPWNHRAHDPWRFSDDTHLNYYRVLESNRNSLRQRSRREYNSGNQDVDNPNLHTPPPRLPPSPLQQPPVNTVKQKKNRVHRNVAADDGERNRGSGTGTESSEQKGGRDEKKRSNTEKRRARSSEPRRIQATVIDPSPGPSSPPPVSPSTERKTNDGNAKKDFFTSFHHKKKKKRQRDRSVDNLGALLHHPQPPAVKFQPPAPPPPPPPPAVRHHLFPSKKENRKKFISIPPPPPPPPPPRCAIYPPRATVTRVAPFVTDKPGAFLMSNGFSGIDDSSSGGESPMKRIPPPPPLPPFKMPDWKFAVEGDFVRLQSALSSTSVSPDGDEARSPSSDVDTPATAMVVFPDLDTKADSFIARFRAGLKLERMSKLGPGPGSGPGNN